MNAKRLILALTAVALLVGADATEDERLLREAGLPSDDAGLVAFFRNRSPRDEDVRALVKKLGDDDFEARERASRELLLLGPVATPFLKEGAASSDPEVKRRSEECLKKIGAGPSAATIAAAARTLARRKPAGALEALLAYAPKVEGESTGEEVRSALAALAQRDGKTAPALVAALADSEPGRRAAAAVALARAGTPEDRAAVRKLLADPKPTVRLHTALALAARREKEAVPVLIDLANDVGRGQIYHIEDIFYRLAEDKAPDVVFGEEPAARKKYRDAWAAWWAKEGNAIDLAKLDAAPPFHNYTMFVLLDAGRVAEVDGDQKLRWEIKDLLKPLDVQMLPGGGRVLVAEHDANRVTERNLRGQVLWERRLADGPLAAQRLPNGNTLIATRGEILEVDRTDKPVFRHFARPGEFIMRAQRARNGDLGYIVNSLTTGTTAFVRLDPSGKELTRFPVDVRTSGGRVEMLPNGHVLIPLMDENRVVEFDANGRPVWQATFLQPVAAVRAPNGQTVVTSMQSTKAAALDEKGKEVWEFNAGARVTRAWRR